MRNGNTNNKSRNDNTARKPSPNEGNARIVESDMPPRALQENLLTVLTYKEEGREIAEQIAAELFDGDYAVFAERAISYWKQYDQPPGDHIADLLEDIIGDRNNKRRPNYIRVIKSMMEVEKSINVKFVVDQRDAFLRTQHYKLATLKTAAMLNEKGATDKIEEVWNDTFASTRSNIGKKYTLVRAADVELKPTLWIWKNHMARGVLDILTGPPGMGKSTLQCCLAACLTTCADWPDGSSGPELPCNVIFVIAEDTKSEVVLRLKAAGTDINRITFLELIRKDNKERAFLLGEDLKELEQAIREVNAGVVFIDPITAFMGKVNSSSPTDVRSQLTPLAKMAERANVAVSIVTHPSKGTGIKAIDSFIGSQAFVAAPRIAYLCVEEFQDQKPTGRNLYVSVLNRMGPKPPTLANSFDIVRVSTNESSPMAARATQTEVTRVEWSHAAVDVSADQALANAKDAAMPSTRRTPEVHDFMKTMLKGGPKKKADMIVAGNAAGYSNRKLERAAHKLGLVSEKGFQGDATWRLPKGPRDE